MAGVTRFTVWEGEEGHRTVRDIFEVEPVLTPKGRIRALVARLLEDWIELGCRIEIERREQ